MSKKLFHISFRDNLEGVWKPRLPAGSEHSNKHLRETDIPRISFAPTIEQCFWGVYQNVKRYFIKDKFPYMNFHIYCPKDQSGLKLIDHEELTRKRMVPDAHITEEVISTTEVEMLHIGEVMIFNCLNEPIVSYHPYNDVSIPMKELSHYCKVRPDTKTLNRDYISTSDMLAKNKSMIERWSKK